MRPPASPCSSSSSLPPACLLLLLVSQSSEVVESSSSFRRPRSVSEGGGGSKGASASLRDCLAAFTDEEVREAGPPLGHACHEGGRGERQASCGHRSLTQLFIIITACLSALPCRERAAGLTPLTCLPALCSSFSGWMGTSACGATTAKRNGRGSSG